MLHKFTPLYKHAHLTHYWCWVVLHCLIFTTSVSLCPILFTYNRRFDVALYIVLLELYSRYIYIPTFDKEARYHHRRHCPCFSISRKRNTTNITKRWIKANATSRRSEGPLYIIYVDRSKQSRSLETHQQQQGLLYPIWQSIHLSGRLIAISSICRLINL